MPRTVLVTGAARNIGRRIADTFTAQGDRVVGIDLQDGGDVANESDVVRAVEECGERIDVVVHNAGIGHGAKVTELSLDDWNRVLAVNLTAAFLLAKHASPRMPDGSSIVLIASTRALQSEPDTEAYAASKGGLVALTHSLAVSLGPRIRVNCISPGWIHHGGALSDEDLSQHPAGRVGTSDDVAELCLFLASDQAGFITGQNHVVDGGMTVRMRYV